MSVDESGPAFPVEGRRHSKEVIFEDGLTIRRYYAIKIIVGLLAQETPLERRMRSEDENVKKAFRIADLMIAEGEK